MNNLFTPMEERKLQMIERLTSSIITLQDQREGLSKKDDMRMHYDYAIASTLGTIGRISNKLEQEGEPDDISEEEGDEDTE